MRIVILIISLLLISTPLVNSADITARWAWNGQGKVISGFRFYLDDRVAHEVTNPDSRIATWVMDLKDGRHTFSMTGYGEDWESKKSEPYIFEYINIETELPAPKVHIQIN